MNLESGGWGIGILGNGIINQKPVMSIERMLQINLY